MVFVKVVKTRSYFKRFQTKYRRRRECKTDYQARRAMITQDRTKYNSPKYRLVVRFTNSRCVCQIVYATIQGDRVVCAADSRELARYGMPVGLTNFAAAYATGLLVSRRALKQLGLDQTFTGVAQADGAEYHVEEADNERRPFKCILDIGLTRTTTGNRVFAAMKGAVDGGIHIPHNEKRLPGWDKESSKMDAEQLRSRIYGCHVAEYMAKMKEEDEEKYNAHFSVYLKQGIDASNIEEKYKKVHAAIRADPNPAAKKAFVKK